MEMEWPMDFPEDHSFLDLVVPGISTDLDFENLLKDTEDKLKLNADSIEQQLLELQSKMGDSRSGDRPPSPTECLQWFNLRNSTRPVATKPQEILDFLKAMQLYLGTEEDGKEKLTLQLLMDLATQCGICFPNVPSSTFLASTVPSQLGASSMNLVHTVKEDSSIEIQEAWDNVRLLLRRYLINQLSTHGQRSTDLTETSSPSMSQRTQCLQQLCFLYPEAEVLAHYQEFRSQLVLSTLNSVVSSSPCGITGFDRLSKGFSSVVGVLIQAITEDLHVLTRLVEPYRTLAFLNATYMNTLTRELASLVERESETAQRENTMVGSKTRKYTSMSRATVAPLDPPVKSRSFSLTAHQLKALTQMTCTLMTFESNVKELATHMTFVDCTGENRSLKGILKKTKDESETTGGKRSTTDQHSSEDPVLEYEWRSAFKVLAPHMAHCVKVVLTDISAKSLQQEQMVHSEQSGSIDLSRVTGRTSLDAGNTQLIEDSLNPYTEREAPTKILKFCATILDEADTLLPLAIACKDGSLLEVRSSFVEACGRLAFDILRRLEERALEVPSSAPVKNLASILASCIYSQQRLELYRSRLKDLSATSSKVPLTLLPIQKYQDTIKALTDQLAGYCFNVCATCILQDAESHHWADPKPFYEGERCSFSVQMWFYFLCGLRTDLWEILPAALAKDLLGHVMSETLLMLVQRYAGAQPSYKRHPQIRCDITALLLYVEQLLWSVCDSLESYDGTDPPSALDERSGGTDWPRQIHSLCDQLLTVLVVHTSPLSLLHTTFVGNRTKKCGQDLLHRPLWLRAVDQDLCSKRSSEDGRRGEVASLCQLRLLTSDPANNPRLLLKLLLDEECYLPRMLLENSGFCQNCDSMGSKENREAADDFIKALFNIFICFNDYPKALTRALQPYLEKTQAWEHLYALADSSEKVPVIVGCIRPVVMTSTDILLKQLVPMVMSWQVKDELKSPVFKQEIPDYVLGKVPKDWNYTPLDALKRESDCFKTVIPNAIQALSFIFTNLPLVVSSLPSPIRYLFQVAEKQLSHHSRQLRSFGLLLWALLNCLIQGLEDPQALETISGLSLDCKAKDRLALLAECLQVSMGIQLKGVPKSTVHKVLQTLEEKRPKWINLQLQKSRKLCSDSVFERAKESGASACEPTEQEMCLMLLEVCHQAGGSDYLRQIHHIIQGNEEFLISKLCGVALPYQMVDFKHSFRENGDAEKKTNHFNPLRHFDRIGTKRLKQSAVADWSWDWPRLLPAYRGMNPVTFKSLLANRWEMQDGAELRDEEKVLVDKLRGAYFVCKCGSGEGDPPDTDEPGLEQTLGAAQSSDRSRDV